MVDAALSKLSEQFETSYAQVGRPSIPPEKLVRALLLQVFYSICSERLLCEQLDYNLLLRWFVGLSMDDVVWYHSTFSKNRGRLMQANVAQAFFEQILAQAKAEGLTSDEHFSVDATLIEAIAGQHRITLAADENYDTQDFVSRAPALNVTPHVAQNVSNRRSAIDSRITCHAGYVISQRVRKLQRIEEVMGWGKDIGPVRKSKFRRCGRVSFQWLLSLTGYNLNRMRNFAAELP